MNLVKDLESNVKKIEDSLPIKQSFDFIGKYWTVGNRNAYMAFIDGFTKDEIMFYIMQSLKSFDENNINIGYVKDLMRKNIPYIEVTTFKEIEDMTTFVLSGMLALVIDGIDEGILIDVRTYPVRSPEEPDLEKVTRGSRDGFVETIIFNTALIRRRIRNPDLIFEIENIGDSSRSDVAIGYIENMVNKELLDKVKTKLKKIKTHALVMAEKTLEELLIEKRWYNPFPQVRFTERPDVVAAHLHEGHIAIIVDNSPSIMLLPVTFFHFTQHAEDYYQNPLVGTYIRWIRFIAMIVSFIITPLWLLIVIEKSILPEFLNFLGPKKPGEIPLFVQFIILEMGIDFLRIASIHTPNTLSTSLGIIGGLILGEFAVKVGWFVPESILYMAVAAIGTFATPSIEYSMALRIFRLFLLILTGLFKIIGFIGGIVVICIISFTTKTFDGKSYFWPLIPLDLRSLSHIILRKPIPEIRKRK